MMPNVRTTLSRCRRRLASRASSRRGAALVEMLVAMTVMVIGLTGVAGMTISAGKRASTLTGVGGRTAIQTHVTDQLMVLPYAQLTAQGGCVTVTTMPYPHRRCTTVADVASDRRQITVVFTPAYRQLRPDTVVIERANVGTANPFR